MNLPGRDGASAQHAQPPALRTVEPAAQAPAAAPQAVVRRASRSDQDVVVLRRLDLGGRIVVECDVHPVSGLRTEPLHPGPYGFPSPAEADLFIADALRALDYLGCEIA